MPNTREKLIELLDCTYGQVEDRDYDCYGECKTCQAENLIANGVGFLPKWIPVTERLPEDDSDVLAYLRIGEEGRIYPATYAKGMWFDCIFNTPATSTTTHWMPLPEPPKGE